MDESASRATQSSAGAGTDLGLRLIARWTDLGWAIREARLAQGLSQHRLAALAGVSRAWLARVETGHRKAELELLMRTLEALGLSFSVGPAPSVAVSDPELDEALRIAGLK